MIQALTLAFYVPCKEISKSLRKSLVKIVINIVCLSKWEVLSDTLTNFPINYQKTQICADSSKQVF